MRFAPSLKPLYERYAYGLMCFGVACIPIKLILAYFVLIPLCILWINFSFDRRNLELAPMSKTLAPLWLFFAAMLISSLAGLTPMSSCAKLLGLAFFTLFIPMFFDLMGRGGWTTPLSLLLCAQSVAALHSVLQASFPASVPKLFLGKVTESGQLGLSLVVAFALTLWAISDTKKALNPVGLSHLGHQGGWRDVLWGGANFLLLLSAPFYPSLQISPVLSKCALALGLVSVAGVIVLERRSILKLASSYASLSRVLMVVILPLLSVALLVNLKRGPWGGATVGILILLALYCRRYLITLFTVGVAMCLLLQPVRERLIDSAAHFYISGGRSEIWDIGLDLMKRFPLGLGYSNSHLLSSLSDEIPPELTHFHNNFVNIAAETGWISLALFVWWFSVLLTLAFRNMRNSKDSIMRVGVGAALLSWQLAGLVEYNFGDSEVLLVVYFLVGVMAYLIRQESQSTSEQPPLRTLNEDKRLAI